MKFVGLSLSESEKDFKDEFVKKLQDAVRKVKTNREMGDRYMTFEELLEDERIGERQQVIIEFLEELGEVPENLQEKIKQVNDLNVLKTWSKIAAKAESIAQFEKDILKTSDIL